LTGIITALVAAFNLVFVVVFFYKNSQQVRWLHEEATMATYYNKIIVEPNIEKIHMYYQKICNIIMEAAEKGGLELDDGVEEDDLRTIVNPYRDSYRGADKEFRVVFEVAIYAYDQELGDAVGILLDDAQDVFMEMLDSIVSGTKPDVSRYEKRIVENKQKLFSILIKKNKSVDR
jgi:hypothetical protein